MAVLLNQYQDVHLMDQKHVFHSEEEIWNAFRSGNEWAYEVMFNKNYPLMLNYGLKFNHSEEDVKDCIQQLFTGLWESRLRLGPNTSIKSYLLASLRRMILRQIKRKSPILNIESINPRFYVESSPEAKYIKDQTEQRRVEYVSDLIKILPNRQKEALYLKFYGEHSFGEIAVIMGISTRAVYKLIYKALDKLALKARDNKDDMI